MSRDNHPAIPGSTRVDDQYSQGLSEIINGLLSSGTCFLTLKVSSEFHQTTWPGTALHSCFISDKFSKIEHWHNQIVGLPKKNFEIIEQLRFIRVVKLIQFIVVNEFLDVADACGTCQS